MDIKERAREQLNGLERVLLKIPGFKGYFERELRRDSDRLQREYVVKQLRRVKTGMNKSLQAASRAKDFERLRESASVAGKAVADSAAVRIVLDNGSELPQRGRLLFSDLTVDPTSAQVTLRTEVANPQARLLPGMYVRTRLVQGQIVGAMLLPQQAVTRGPQGDSVLVVGEGGKPAPRPVKIGGAFGSQWIVLDGLKPGEQVIAEGFQKMRPGAPVKPVPFAGGLPTQGPASAASGATPSVPASAGSR